MKESKTLFERKIEFFKKFPDLSIFDVHDVNYTKLCLNGLFFKKRQTYDYSNYFSYFSYFSFKENTKNLLFRLGFKNKKQAFKNFKNIKNKEVDYLLVDVNRTLFAHQEVKSIYFENIVPFFKKTNQSFLYCNGTNTSSKIKGLNFEFYQIFDYIISIPLDKYEKKLFKETHFFLKNLKRNNDISEQNFLDIAFAVMNFFTSFIVWNKIFQIINVKKVIFICHYYNEGLIHACKRNGIKIKELQHGLISEKDGFYVLPENIKSVKKRAFFPDEIYTYGNFWTDRLKNGFEFDNHQIKEVGYYQYETNEEQVIDNTDLKEKTVLLITTQITLSSYWIKYIQWLMKDIKDRNLNMYVIVKLHPSEKLAEYENLNHLENMEIINHISLPNLFKLADMHMTVSSTSLYEAIRFGVKLNFTYFIDFHRDYVEEIVNNNLAILIKGFQNPFDFLEKELNLPDKIYEKSNLKIIL